MNDVRFVKDGVARALRTLRAATSPEPGDCALRTCRVGDGAHEPGCVDHRRDACRQLEDQPHGCPLLCRGNCRTWSRRALPCRSPSLLSHIFSTTAASAG